MPDLFAFLQARRDAVPVVFTEQAQFDFVGPVELRNVASLQGPFAPDAGILHYKNEVRFVFMEHTFQICRF